MLIRALAVGFPLSELLDLAGYRLDVFIEP